MNKVVIKLSLIGFVLFFAVNAFACVGRTLYIGSLETDGDKIMAEMLATLINERTGTTIQIRYYPDREALYTALKSDVEEKRADILIENTVDAMKIVGKESNQLPDNDLITAKELYEKELGIIWLNPFGFSNSTGASGQSISAPLVRRDILTNFPLLPRILNKLSGVFTNEIYSSLQKEVADGEKPKNAAKNFLKKRKLI